MTEPLRPAEAFSEIGRIKLDATDLDGVLARIGALAERTIPRTDEVSVTLVQGPTRRTAAFTSERARDLDLVQYERDRGPCLDASASGDTILVPATAAEERWPGWAEQAYDDEAVDLARTFAAYAAVAVANAHLYDSTAALAEQMRAAMANRAVIEQAKGIIMGERRCSPDEAFALLSKVSQDSNRKVRDVAAALVAQATGRPPG